MSWIAYCYYHAPIRIPKEDLFALLCALGVSLVNGKLFSAISISNVEFKMKSIIACFVVLGDSRLRPFQWMELERMRFLSLTFYWYSITQKRSWNTMILYAPPQHVSSSVWRKCNEATLSSAWYFAIMLVSENNLSRNQTSCSMQKSAKQTRCNKLEDNFIPPSAFCALIFAFFSFTYSSICLFIHRYFHSPIYFLVVIM